MWKLTIEDDEGKQIALPLSHDEYGLGRAETNAVRLTDRNVSRQHASLRRSPQGWVVKDLGSYNGTWVTGVRVDGEQPVRPGDVIQLGDYRIEVVDDTTQIAAPAPGAPAAAPSAQQKPNRLVAVVGPNPGAEFPLDREHLTIGRSEEANVSINHTSVSRLHAELFALGGGRFEIVDKGSANGIRVNGVELQRGILEAGDALELGDVRLRYVGVGKIFRANLDPAHLAVGGFESVARSQAPGRRAGLGTGKIMGLAAIVGVLVIGGIAFVARPGSTNTRTNSAEQAADPTVGDGVQFLDEARKKLEAKDYDGAHQQILKIPEASAVRDEPDVKKIEAAWGDSMFQKVDAATDTTEKKRILKAISATPTVDAALRKRAADMIGDIEAKEPPPPSNNAEPGVPRAPVNNGPAATSASSASGPSTNPVPVVGAPAVGPPDEEVLRKQLEPKVYGGRASVSEIRMLRAICSHLGNHACRDRANAMLKAKTEGQ